jgi:hypothetical protein
MDGFIKFFWHLAKGVAALFVLWVALVAFQWVWYSTTITPPTWQQSGGQTYVGRGPHVSNQKGIHYLPNSPPGCNIACNGVVRESKIPPPSTEAECNAWQYANIRRVCNLR